jgi:ribonucleoside-diphosphate reductase alpha chain
MEFTRFFTSEENGPYKKIVWECRTSELRDSKGNIIFSMNEVIVPSTWSQVATDILAQKYFRKAGVPSNKEFAWKEYLQNYSHPGSEEIKTFPITRFEGSEYDARQVFHRLAYTWSDWGRKNNIFTTWEDKHIFYEETLYMLAHQIAAPNSPQWFNTGLYSVYGITGNPQGHYYYDEKKAKIVASKNAYERPSVHACFILPVKDDLVNENGIYDTITKQARLFKHGSGTGSNVSNIRGKNEKLSGGGVSSGLLSFLQIFDKSTAAIKSGGVTRRAASMLTLDIDHPDIEEFINWKVKEEHKVSSLVAGSLIIKQYANRIEKAIKESTLDTEDKYDSTKNHVLKNAIYAALNHGIPDTYLYQILYHLKTTGSLDDLPTYTTAWESEAYETVSGQSSNNSIRVTDKFMRAVTTIESDADWELKSRVNGEVLKTVKAKDLWEKIIKSAWRCADPGIQFHDTMNLWHTCPNGGEIRGSNPCSEFVFLDSTACNLASLNLSKFSDNKTFDITACYYAVQLWTTILEISVGMAQYPDKDIALNSYDYRPLGLGFAGLGSLIMRLGIPYDSEEGRLIGTMFSSLLTSVAYLTSAKLAQELKPFNKFDENKEAMLKIIERHMDGIKIYSNELDPLLTLGSKRELLHALSGISAIWEEAYELGKKCGFRNAQVTCIAPTGTIGLLMDCDTTGIEPDFSLVKYKKLAGGGYFKMVNQSLPPALKRLGYTDEEIDDITTYVLGHQCLVPDDDEKGISVKKIIDRVDSHMFQYKTADGNSHMDRARLNNLIQYFKDKAKTAITIDDIFGTISSDEYNKILFHDLIGRRIPRIDAPYINLADQFHFSKEELDYTEAYVCGTMTIEGAPHLKEKHYEVFDTASLCGKQGTRVIHWKAHIDMMAAVQPFISGAISKTINMPNTATYEDIECAYKLAWTKGLKSITIYRDKSKLSQPLSSFGNDMDELSRSIYNAKENSIEVNSEDTTSNRFDTKKENITKCAKDESSHNQRMSLPTRRRGYIQKAKIAGHSLFLHTGEYENGKLGEIFIDMHREGAAFRSLLNSFAIAVSLGLQYGVPLEEYVDAFVFSKFEPNGIVQGHKYIKMVTSVIDYIFRDLAINYLKRNDLGQVKPEDLVETNVSSPIEKSEHDITQAEVDQLFVDLNDLVSISNKEVINARLKGYEGDPCPSCGSLTLVRSGTCMKCDTCGSTTGCS